MPLHLIKAFKDAALIGCRDARAVVHHPETPHVPFRQGENADVAAVRGVTRGIFHQIPKHLHEQAGIAAHRAGVGDVGHEPQAASVHLAAAQPLHELQHGADGHILERTHMLGIQAGQLQQVVHHTGKGTGVAIDDLRETAFLRGPFQLEQGLRRSLYGGERRPQLMGHVGHEVPPHLLQPDEGADIVEYRHQTEPVLGQPGAGEHHRQTDAGGELQRELALRRQGLVVHLFGQQAVHGILQGRMRDGLDDLRAELPPHHREQPDQRRVAAAYLTLRTEHQHSVAHGVQHGFELGRLIGGVAHLALDIGGHAVHRFHQWSEFLPRQAAKAALKIVVGNGLNHVDHRAQRRPQRAGQHCGQQHGHHRGHGRHLEEHRHAAGDDVLQHGQRQGQPQDAAVVQRGGGIGEVLPQRRAVPDGEARALGRGLTHLRTVTVIVHAFGTHAAGAFQHDASLRVGYRAAYRPVIQTFFHQPHALREIRRFLQQAGSQPGVAQHILPKIIHLFGVQEGPHGKQPDDPRCQRHHQHRAEDPEAEG